MPKAERDVAWAVDATLHTGHLHGRWQLVEQALQCAWLGDIDATVGRRAPGRDGCLVGQGGEALSTYLFAGLRIQRFELIGQYLATQP